MISVTTTRTVRVLYRWLWLLSCGTALLALPLPSQGAASLESAVVFPRPLASYAEPAGTPLFETLKARVQAEPLNLVVTLLFLLAIIHTFLAPKFLQMAHRLEERHQARMGTAGGERSRNGRRGEVSFTAEIYHFFGEVEAIFGIWVVPLLVVVSLGKGWTVARDYLGRGLDFTEPLFVVVIMTMAASRPVLIFSEKVMSVVASLGKGTPAAWWFSILTIGPILGSFITEPAAMTICALLLAQRLYSFDPAPRLAYATVGLLFVNVSVGGTLTQFAAPPVLMVAGKWGWGMSYMLTHFGWKAAVGMVVANLVYYAWLRGDLRELAARSTSSAGSEALGQPVPRWITAVHIGFLAWTVINSHFPALFIGGFLFYLAFTRATEHHQGELNLRPALLVGFFLAGLVVHGGLQGWWIAPVLSRLNELPLFFGAAGLTAFNDNAAITYLASLVPDFSPALQYAVMAGAVAGGGLTVIANAPNPAGQAILSRFFPDGISPSQTTSRRCASHCHRLSRLSRFQNPVSEQIHLWLLPLDKSLRLPRGALLQDVLFNQGVEFPCGGWGRCKGCKVRVLEGSLAITEDDRRAFSEAALGQGWRLACRARAEGNLTLELAQWDAPILVDDSAFPFTPQDGLGIAIDLGTTTVVAQLLDLRAGQVLAVRTALNAQARYGGDIMTRVEFGLGPGGQTALEKLIREQIGKLVHGLLEAVEKPSRKAGHRAGPARELRRIVVVGNTVMHHLFCGISVKPLSHFPFESGDLERRVLSSEQLGWNLPGNPQVLFFALPRRVCRQRYTCRCPGHQSSREPIPRCIARPGHEW